MLGGRASLTPNAFSLRRPRAWSWSRPLGLSTSRVEPPEELRTNGLIDTPPVTSPSRQPRMPRDKSLDLAGTPADWRISQNWVLVSPDLDAEELSNTTNLAAPSNNRQNRRSAPPVIMSESSGTTQTRVAQAFNPTKVPAHRMKPLPPLPLGSRNEEQRRI